MILSLHVAYSRTGTRPKGMYLELDEQAAFLRF
jgi:hypothetical protein